MRLSRSLARASVLITTFVAALASVHGVAQADEKAAAAPTDEKAAVPSDTRKSVANFTLKNLDEKPSALYDLLAQGPVLISFWATWCKPCLQEMPHLSDVAKAYEGHGLTTLAISIDEPRNKSRVRSYIQSKHFAFQTLLDPNQDAYRKLQGQSVPYVLLLDKTGQVSYAKVGYRPGDEATLESAVKKLLGVEAEKTESAPPHEAKGE
jgi:peroxiredoxin